MPTRTRTITAIVAVAALAIGITACSDDADDATASDEATTTEVASNAADDGAEDLTEFCALATELSGAAAPTQEQIDEYAALAPDQISEPVDTFVAAFTAAEGNLGEAFSDPEVVAASDEIAVFEAEECGITPPGPPDGAGE